MDGRDLASYAVGLLPLAIAGIVYMAKVPEAGKQFSRWVRFSVWILCAGTTFGVIATHLAEKADRLESQLAAAKLQDQSTKLQDQTAQMQKQIDFLAAQLKETNTQVGVVGAVVASTDKKIHKDGALIGSAPFTNVKHVVFPHPLGTTALEIECTNKNGDLLNASQMRWKAADANTVEITFTVPQTGTCTARRQ